MQEKLVNDEHVLHQYHLTIDTYGNHHAVQRRLQKKRVVHNVHAPARGMITTSILEISPTGDVLANLRSRIASFQALGYFLCIFNTIFRQMYLTFTSTTVHFCNQKIVFYLIKD